MTRTRVTTGGIDFVSGNVGIGTASPAWKLDVVGGRSMHAASSESYAVGAKFSSAGGAVYFGAASSSLTPDAVISNAGGFELMRLTTTGSVGIGTASPAQRLHIYHASADCVATIQGRAVSLGGSGVSAAQLDVDGAGGFALRTDATSGTRLFTITSNNGYGSGSVNCVVVTSTGRVGIGTTGPTGKLHAENTDSNLTSIPLIRATGMGTHFDITANSTAAFVGTTTASTALDLVAGAATRLSLGVGASGTEIWSAPTSSLTTTPSFFSRAWARFGGVGSVSVVRSGNVSSISRNAAGDYTVNFNFPPCTSDSDFCCVGACSPGGNSTQDTWVVRPDTFASSSVRISTIRLTASNPYGERADCASVSVVIVR